jgi:hypothetical protein
MPVDHDKTPQFCERRGTADPAFTPYHQKGFSAPPVTGYPAEILPDFRGHQFWIYSKSA